MSERKSRDVLQFCHGYDMPFHDVARQYASLFTETPFRVTTVFLTGKKSCQVEKLVGSDEVIFLENSSKDIRGLKRKQIKQLKEICRTRSFSFCIAHRFKPLYIASHIPNLFVIGVHHAFSDYKRWTRQFFVNRCRERLALVGVSNAIRDDMRKYLPGFPKEKICTLYNRIDPVATRARLFSRKEARQKLNLPEECLSLW